MTQGFCGFHLRLGAGWGCDGGCRAGDGAGFKYVLCLSIKMQINILNSIKPKKYPKLMYEVSMMCSWHLCSDK